VLALLATAIFSVSGPAVAPSKIFIARDPVRISFAVEAARPLDLDVEVVRGSTVARRIALTAVMPGVEQVVRWDGITGAGDAAPDGRYRVRLVGRAFGERRRLGSFTLRGHMYPIRGPHADRGPIGQFGVGRNGGRTHEGYDVNAACGIRLVAARGGTVIRSRYDPVLYGNEVIIRGAHDGRSYRYAHLLHTPLVKRGDKVRTGQRIGSIGATGNARTVGCHLHFELRTHNGRLLDPRPYLHEWDRFS
jgi:murein DD-endopeptidase MepM/ murein hydrolase activator NlpD